jgi:hypothetical protein
MKRIDRKTAGLVGGLVAIVAVAVLATQAGGKGPNIVENVAVPMATAVPEALSSGANILSMQSNDNGAYRASGAPAPVPAPADGAEEAPAGDASGGAATTTPQITDRKIVRTATVTCSVEDVGVAVSKVENAVAAAGGFVSASTFTAVSSDDPEDPEATPAPDQSQATVTIRVPAETYQQVLNEIRGLGEVKSVNSSTSEVTEEYTDLEAQLRHLQATEERYLTLMGSATQINDILALEDRLNQVRLEMERVQGRLQLLTDLTDLATITVTLTSIAAASSQAAVQQPGWAEEAWENAWETSQDVAQALGVAAITAGVILAWLVIPVTVLIVAWRMFGNRKGGESAAS